MLTGEPPFMADVAAAVLHQHVRVAPKPPSQRNPGIPPALDALVLEMLAKAPEDRPQTAAEVRDRLAALDSATRSATTPAWPPPPAPAWCRLPRGPSDRGRLRSTQPIPPPPAQASATRRLRAGGADGRPGLARVRGSSSPLVAVLCSAPPSPTR